MNTRATATEVVVLNHLQAFVDKKGIAAIVSDYDDNARFYSEPRTYHGKSELAYIT